MSAPSGYTALDFVGFTDKGTYSPIVTYMRNDLVHYGGNIMRCLIDNTKNVTPVVGANWELWVGASANLVERVIAPLENNPADVAFGVGRQIIYDDWLWEVIAPIAVGDTLVDYAVDPTNANIKKSAPVETQLLAVKAEADATDNMIAPTETNASSSSAAYAVGDQLILNNILYTVTAPVTIGDALVSGTGGNIEASDSLTDQLAAKADDSALATVAKTGAYSDLLNKPTLGTAAAKDSTNAVTQSSTDLVESGAVYTEVNTVKQALTTAYQRITDTQSSIAPVETGTKYSKTYIQYERFIKDNKLYKVTSASVGTSDNIQVNVNCKLVDNVESYENVSYSDWGVKIRVVRNDRTCVLEGLYTNSSVDLTQYTNTLLGNLKESLRPTNNHYFGVCIVDYSGVFKGYARISVGQSGDVNICPSQNIPQGSPLFFQVSYISQ